MKFRLWLERTEDESEKIKEKWDEILDALGTDIDPKKVLQLTLQDAVEGSGKAQAAEDQILQKISHIIDGDQGLQGFSPVFANNVMAAKQYLTVRGKDEGGWEPQKKVQDLMKRLFKGDPQSGQEDYFFKFSGVPQPKPTEEETPVDAAQGTQGPMQPGTDPAMQPPPGQPPPGQQTPMDQVPMDQQMNQNMEKPPAPPGAKHGMF